jgi:hypothetical protein
MRGIWLPRRSIQQREYGVAVDLKELVAGDLVFCTGRLNYYDSDPSDGVGHVGMAIDSGTIIHAANSKLGVIESSVETFIGSDKFRGARRIIPVGLPIVTLETPLERDVESSDDIKWIVLQNLPCEA